MPQEPSHEAHRREADKNTKDNPVCCAVLIVSDTRTLETDRGGALIVEHLTQAGHQIASLEIVKDEQGTIRERLKTWCADPEIQVILTTGGTGVSRRDITTDVVRGLLSFELQGFGELFRMLSYEQVKSAAMLSRAIAGLVIGSEESGGDTFIFALPGSTNAVETAMSNLVIPQLPHLVWERMKEDS
ncbi:MAG: MogA/MoaB family molybdenum cofactor biosynthesis protein [Planctomycetota bacterium]|nr:MogA/MoaB family molybdenum cofactor biosynthesis protein [Planctomycetota bacterium]